VGYCIVSCLNEADCHHYALKLLEGYMQALTIAATDKPTLDEAWLRFRAAPAAIAALAG